MISLITPDENKPSAEPLLTDTTLDGIRDIKVYQNKEGYRFSVDAVLLYTFADMRYARNIADLGTGSGIIGLLLARKYPKAKVSLVELQESLYGLALKNIEINALGDRVNAVLADIKHLKDHFACMTYDLVVSNPPFRKPTTGKLSIGQERAIARHELALKISELAAAASYLLKAKGRFFMIYHPERLLEAVDALRSSRLEPKRVRFVHNDAGAESKIVLIEAVKEARPGVKIENPLFIYNADGSYTAEVSAMYGDGR
jgi:tRNA1Val (adenine37-N6)-methyltransferase